MSALTRKQQAILDFLLDNQAKFPRPPSLNELCQALGLKSRGSLHLTLSGLIDAGFVEAMGHKHRGVRLTEKALALRESDHHRPQALPLVGSIAAGKPIEAIEHTEWINVPDQIRTEQSCYVLKVKGDSMIEAGILDGDWVVIEQRSHAQNGEIVVALIDNQEATLKVIEQTADEVLLIPANSSMEAMRFHPSQVSIQGVLVGQMRSYR
ncbi:MAG: transcriptional repressor LexA [Methylomonas sp.]|jgi:repressor LexA|uniref:transcriptional repressor LexA n=1 Tax=Methylomonas sp. TaxID=418 RepID=UPI0025EB623C|nr:transcriptional repressor LexA [Methylomonas sp.]MCK9609497.1 transcriptional repressor LexA [Methylomonas sp.]